MIQRCRCSRCRKTFSVTYSKRAYFWEVYEKIIIAHQKASLECARENSVKRVRLLPADKKDG